MHNIFLNRFYGNSHSQINIHCVFAIKGRENTISKGFRDELNRYMPGVLKNDNAFPFALVIGKIMFMYFLSRIQMLRIQI